MNEQQPPNLPAPHNERLEDIMVGLLRWGLYSVFMLLLLAPWVTGWRLVTGCLLLGHISAQLNKIINSLKQPDEKN